MLYADVIVDISHENIDKTYQYQIPKELEASVGYGTPVRIPFGRGSRSIKGYIVGFSEKPSISVERIKAIEGVIEDGVVIESQLITLAWWMKENYGSTMNDALKTVLPVKEAVKAKERAWISLAKGRAETVVFLEESKKKSNKGRVRLLKALLEKEPMELSQAVSGLGIARTTLKDMEKLGYIHLDRERVYRNPVSVEQREEKRVILNGEQRRIADTIIKEWETGHRDTYLIHGVTGSGKTEVYLEIIEAVLKRKQQVIMLIPEIALTFQTVLRFYRRLGERVSVLHSRMSKGERYDQYVRAKNGDIDVIIGPRSALFAPFERLGLIIIDEEHEGSYKSEGSPKYHARETAIERARLQGASVILGSATPSLESYYKAEKGEYRLFTMKERAGEGRLPLVHITDLREELKKGNKSIFGELLREKLLARLEKGEQSMLFINRRGYAGFVSCRSCGYVVKCPHCDVSLTFHQAGYHREGGLKCHYCGYEAPMPKKCPECGSPYIAAFGTGTQKIEELLNREFPEARVLRMDMDTTQGKDGHERILSAFMNHKADILVGTQMIVKGHDFPDVTLVGVLAADLSLYAGDFRSSEKTFQLLCQAAGRAGRGRKPGEVVIQTYNPEHYSIVTAARQDYPAFYEQEILYRSMASYPPVSHMLVVFVTAREEELARRGAECLKEITGKQLLTEQVAFIGPAAATVGKVNDIYRQVLYIKSVDYNILKEIKNFMEGYLSCTEEFKRINVQFDFDPMFHY
ncbi:replication restart helicase PriA [Acetivibrio ethanolgignens]|uniref:replication restart helicase PriA n=1 Tax=Acetivibrio ethanolgignens TaxID=290052 RepID=UPI000A778F7D|nr:primosomal protein N' [Acetivibrio ethanolgignens]